MKTFFINFIIFLTSTNLLYASVKLTKEERAWIQDHPKIVLGVEETWAPYIIINSDGTLSGIDVDTVKHLNKILGTNITFTVGKWSVLNEMLKDNQIDGLSCSSKAPQRAEYANYTNSYSTIVKSIFTKAGNPLHFSKVEDISGKKIAIQESNLFDEKLIKKYKNVQIVNAKDYRVMSDLVLSGKADGFIGGDLTHYNLTKFGMTSVEPVLTIGEPLELVFAIRKDWPELVSIINKGLNELSKKQLHQIKEKYIHKRKITDYTLVFQITGAIVVFIILLMYRQKLLSISHEKLEIEINKKTQELQNINKNLEKKVQEKVEQLRKKDTQILHQAKMASLGKMIEHIAHQWRQPLTVITMSSSIIKLDHELGTINNETLAKLTENINQNALYLSEIIDTFSNFIKTNQKIENIIVQDAVNKITSLVDCSLKNNNIKLINQINSVKSIEFKIILDKFNQVILNILNNAIYVLKENSPENPWIKINLIKNIDTFTITIEDNGGGIDEDLINNIFDPYVTTKHKSVGTGLGLYVVYKIVVEQYFGKVYAENTDNGVIFFIEFPFKP